MNSSTAKKQTIFIYKYLVNKIIDILSRYRYADDTSALEHRYDHVIRIYSDRNIEYRCIACDQIRVEE